MDYKKLLEGIGREKLPHDLPKGIEPSLASKVKTGAPLDKLDVYTASRAENIEQLIALLIVRGFSLVDS